VTGHDVFRLFKYTVYALLCWDGVLFFLDDASAAPQVFGDSIAWSDLIDAYSATFDTGAWIVLLLLLELETAVVSDEKLRGGLKWAFLASTGLCYAVILWAFYGYWQKYLLMSATLPFVVDDPCSLIGSAFTYVVDLDDYAPIDAAACAVLEGAPLFQVVGTQILGTADALTAAVRLALTDVVNAADWLLVVALLEIEVWLQLRGRLTPHLARLFVAGKAALYAVLVACAIYWGYASDFVDFWDAVLWIVAFVFIELNVFEWSTETGTDGG
jgi:hypothetical protein